MRVKNLLLQGGGLLVVLLSTIVSAEDSNKKESSVIPSAEIQEGEVVHVIKLKDILQGKYSKEKKLLEPKKVSVDSNENQPVVVKNSAETVKPAATSKNNSIDLKEAFAAVMGYSNDPVVQDKESKPQVTRQQVVKAVPATNGKSAGWLYLGKFSQGQWDQKNNQVLGLNGALPITGQQYSVRVSSNVRQGYPSKKGMPPIVKVLPQGSKIKLLGVHNSGKSGHYWANVQWFK